MSPPLLNLRASITSSLSRHSRQALPSFLRQPGQRIKGPLTGRSTATGGPAEPRGLGGVTSARRQDNVQLSLVWWWR